MPSRKSVHPSTYQEVSNRNFLSVVGFKFLLNRCPKVDFYCNTANIPEVTLGTAVQRTYLKDIPVPGDKLQYGDLNITFLVDEDMANWKSIHDWMKGVSDFEDFRNTITPESDHKSDARLVILSNGMNPNVEITFKDCFPTSISGLDYSQNQTDVEYLTAEVNFKYKIYELVTL